MVDRAVDALDLDSPHTGFSRYKVPKLEHQIVNIRHIEHHMAQLAGRLRSSANVGVRWVGLGPAAELLQGPDMALVCKRIDPRKSPRVIYANRSIAD